jgi:ATP-binding protein involved in chromosome partitioning
MSARITTEQVLAALATVNDPELHKSLTELGMVDKIVIEGATVSFDIILTTKACPLKDLIKQDAARAVQAIPGVETVNVSISGKTISPRLPEKNPLPGIKNIIAVSSGKGGVGKSTVAVNIACAIAAQGASVGILDADIHGPNVPIMMGLQGSILKEMDENKKAILPQNHGVKVMSISFLVKPDQALIWRGPILHKSISQFFSDMAWGELDYLIIDLPPGTGDAQLSISQLAPVTGGVIVTTPQDVSLADCRRAHTMFKTTNIPVLGVVENMSYFLNRHGERENLFGEGGGTRFCEELDIPLLAQVPLLPQIREDADHGMPIVVSSPDCEAALCLRKAAQQVVATICDMSTLSLAAKVATEPVDEPTMTCEQKAALATA